MDYPFSEEMDLDDGWDMLEDEGFLVGGREFVSRDVGLHDKSLLVDVNYFICPPSPPPPPPLPRHDLIQGSEEGIKDVDPMPPWLEPKIEKNLEEEKDIPVFSITLQKEIFLQEPGNLPKFVDIKPAVLPEIFHGGVAPGEERSMTSGDFASVPKLVVGEKSDGSSLMGELVEGEKSHGSGFTIWRWRIDGIGAMCSIGRMVAATAAAAAAATICVVVLGGSQSQKQHQHQRQQKIRFHVYADDSRIKEILHHAGRLNQTLSVARGIPITGAQISFRN